MHVHAEADPHVPFWSQHTAPPAAAASQHFQPHGSACASAAHQPQHQPVSQQPAGAHPLQHNQEGGPSFRHYLGQPPTKSVPPQHQAHAWIYQQDPAAAADPLPQSHLGQAAKSAPPWGTAQPNRPGRAANGMVHMPRFKAWAQLLAYEGCVKVRMHERLQASCALWERVVPAHAKPVPSFLPACLPDLHDAQVCSNHLDQPEARFLMRNGLRELSDAFEVGSLLLQESTVNKAGQVSGLGSAKLVHSSCPLKRGVPPS